MAKRKRRRLTKAEKEIIWGKTAANAGAGWESPYRAPTDGIQFEQGGDVPGLDLLDDPERAARRT